MTVRPDFVSPTLAEPKAAIIIVNWNYARFISDAIQSVKGQTYRKLECVIVDNGSSDDSVSVIEREIAGDPRFTLTKLPRNIGQLDATVGALNQVTAEFLTILDADDYLLPDYLAWHIQAHLSAIHPIAFSSSGCLEVNAEKEVISGSYGHFRRANVVTEPILTDEGRAILLEATSLDEYKKLAMLTRYLPPYVRGWGWGPGSSNLFRRSLVLRCRPSPLSVFAFGTNDGFFMPLLHSVAGSILIDQPLSAYRLHSSNDFTAVPSVPHVRGLKKSAWVSHDAVIRRSMASIIDGFDDHIFQWYQLWAILDSVHSFASKPPLFPHADIKDAFIRQYSPLAEAFGERSLLRNLRDRMPWSDCCDVALRHKRGAASVTTWRRAVSIELARKMPRRKQRQH